MPRRRTYAGRRERSQRRSRYELRSRSPHFNPSNDINNENNSNLEQFLGQEENQNLNQLRGDEARNQLLTNELLNDSFKCARIVKPSNFNSYECGPMNSICRFCQAKHFIGEMTQNDRTSFTICCHKGKVVLIPYSRNSFIENLFEGLNSPNPSIKRQSKNFFANIRTYNAAFAMVSSEAKLDERVLGGVYQFKIHDVFYHRIGGLIPSYGRDPSYAQLYFYDVETATRQRCLRQGNNNCDESLMRQIAYELDRVNPYIRSFKTMHEVSNAAGNASKEVTMVIKVNKDLDLRRFNDVIQTDVAVIFASNDGDPPFERNIIAFHKNNSIVKNISVLDCSLDPLAYPLLFPNGDMGWQMNSFHNIPSTSNARIPRNRVTMLQYASYRISIREGISILHHCQKLFLQWIVDMYVRIEGSRLHYIKQNQANLRCELYNNLTDYLSTNNNDSNANIGRRVVLPSSFIGSPRNMYQNYLDAMSIVQHFGKPSLFITMTCNPNWFDIQDNIHRNDSANFRPDIVVRVFKLKLKELLKCIVTVGIFGRVRAIIYTIEFQKRGLPHAHILLTLCEEDKIDTVEAIDSIVCAEIPNVDTHPKLHDYVKRHMMHGPCGILNSNAVCMVEGKCSKQYPKNFCNTTREADNGYPVYMRRDSGTSVDVRGSSLDNRYVVPYNPYLLAKFDCHINVEVCTTVKSVKYIYKYIYKGYDCASIELGDAQNRNVDLNFDEVRNFLSGRYVGSTEAAWRIFEFEMHYQSHVIYRLDIHLPNRQNVLFRPGHERDALQNVRNTKLLAYFQLNRDDNHAHDFLYTEIPVHYVWNDRNKIWNRRVRGGNKIIARMYVVSPKDIELFHLRLLLLHVRGATSFDDLRTVNGQIFDTFVAACHAMGIASDDNEWKQCLEEAKSFQSPFQLRELFAFICALNMPTNALALWNEFKDFFSEDYARRFEQNIAYNKALLDIEEILIVHNLNCQSFGLPTPRRSEDNIFIDAFNPEEEQNIFQEMYSNANSEQRNIIDRVLREVEHHDTGSNVFCLTAHAGCGKTFVQSAIIHRLKALNLKIVVTAFSGIASTLLIGGRTLHNAFKLPIPILETSVPNVTPNNAYGQYLQSLSLILIDEISMCPIHVFTILDRFFRDLATNEVDKNKLFGGKTFLLSGDFRQILPVLPHGSRTSLIENCIVSWSKFPLFQHVTLTQNMRARPEEVEFVDFLRKMGSGQLQTYPDLGDDMIEIPNHLIGDLSNIITEVYGDVRSSVLSDQILNSAILAPKNDDCSLINDQILNCLEGEEKIYCSFDKVRSDSDAMNINEYPVEFLNSLNVSGMPPHKLKLKVNSIVMLIRNLNTSKCLVNGTRMRVKCLHRNSIDCEVLTGFAKGNRILIPRINLTFSGSILPFQFQRTQFPILPAFAMTINKSQGQTFEKVGILLRRPVFSHGQLYVAASRVRSFDGLRFYVSNENGHGNLLHDDKVFTKNIVYREILRTN